MDIRKIGTVGVDSGTVMLVDPCYVLGRKDYPETLPTYDELLEVWERLNDYSAVVQPWGEGLGLVTPTYYGDGSYNVYGEFTSVNATRPSRIVIEFDEREEEDDEDDEAEDIWSSEEEDDEE